MIRSAKDIFEEELSGEPLTQESVIEAIKIAQKELLEYIDQGALNDLGNSPEYFTIYYNYIEPNLLDLKGIK